jgi:hypothetical protein
MEGGRAHRIGVGDAALFGPDHGYRHWIRAPTLFWASWQMARLLLEMKVR